MGIKIYKPTSAGRRNSSVNDFAELTTDRPEKSLCIRIKKIRRQKPQRHDDGSFQRRRCETDLPPH